MSDYKPLMSHQHPGQRFKGRLLLLHAMMVKAGSEMPLYWLSWQSSERSASALQLSGIVVAQRGEKSDRPEGSSFVISDSQNRKGTPRPSVLAIPVH